MLYPVDDPGGNSQRYRWPWFVLAAVLVAIVLAILWMSYAVHEEQRERDVITPPPAGPAR